MKNKTITIYELMGLIKDGKAPKKIKDGYDVYKLNAKKEDYENIHTSTFLYCKFENCTNTKDFLDYTVEILQEENGEKKNLVDLGSKENEPIGFKFDTSINKPVLARRCDNYYYAYPSSIGWIYYRSRYLGKKDKEIIDITFDEWTYKVVETLCQEFKQKDKNDEWEDIEEINIENEGHSDFIRNEHGTKCSLTKHSKIIAEKVNELIKNQKYLKERLDKNE